MRMIDGDKLYSILDNIAAHLFETKSEPECSMAQTIQYVMGIVMDQPTIYSLTNDPLTRKRCGRWTERMGNESKAIR